MTLKNVEVWERLHDSGQTVLCEARLSVDIAQTAEIACMALAIIRFFMSPGQPMPIGLACSMALLGFYAYMSGKRHVSWATGTIEDWLAEHRRKPHAAILTAIFTISAVQTFLCGVLLLSIIYPTVGGPLYEIVVWITIALSAPVWVADEWLFEAEFYSACQALLNSRTM